MTLKAHALGMNSTHFANASGLPNGEQVTTAHDLAILGRAVQERFPRYYHYFSTHAFYYHGADDRQPQSSPRSRRGNGRNQNRLYPRLRLQSSDLGQTQRPLYRRRGARRTQRWARDKIMADLIEDQIDNGATVRTASSITDTGTNPQSAGTPVSQEARSRTREPQSNNEPGLAYAASAPKPDAALDPIQVASLNADVPPKNRARPLSPGRRNQGPPRPARPEAKTIGNRQASMAQLLAAVQGNRAVLRPRPLPRYAQTPMLLRRRNRTAAIKLRPQSKTPLMAVS